jgi:7-cyano-7-deazaguanine synthase
MKPTITLILSGGLDSTILLYWLRQYGHPVQAVSVDYGQRHRKELSYASRHCQALDVPWSLLDLSSVGKLLTGSSQTDPSVPVPDGHYEDASMKATVVPNRNMLMLAAAAAIAITNGGRIIAYAAHAGDHAIYPDCRPQFARALKRALALCDYEPVKLRAPFIKKTKAEIVAIGHSLKVPMDRTWSCYKGKDIHCGKCGTCVERIEAFKKAEVVDWTEYADDSEAVIDMAARKGADP